MLTEGYAMLHNLYIESLVQVNILPYTGLPIHLRLLQKKNYQKKYDVRLKTNITYPWQF